MSDEEILIARSMSLQTRRKHNMNQKEVKIVNDVLLVIEILNKHKESFINKYLYYLKDHKTREDLNSLIDNHLGIIFSLKDEKTQTPLYFNKKYNYFFPKLIQDSIIYNIYLLLPYEEEIIDTVATPMGKDLMKCIHNILRELENYR